MLSPGALEAWYVGIGVPPQGRALVDRIRASDPARRVHRRAQYLLVQHDRQPLSHMRSREASEPPRRVLCEEKLRLPPAVRPLRGPRIAQVPPRNHGRPRKQPVARLRQSAHNLHVQRQDPSMAAQRASARIVRPVDHLAQVEHRRRTCRTRYGSLTPGMKICTSLCCPYSCTVASESPSSFTLRESVLVVSVTVSLRSSVE